MKLPLKTVTLKAFAVQFLGFHNLSTDGPFPMGRYKLNVNHAFQRVQLVLESMFVMLRTQKEVSLSISHAVKVHFKIIYLWWSYSVWVSRFKLATSMHVLSILDDCHLRFIQQVLPFTITILIIFSGNLCLFVSPAVPVKPKRPKKLSMATNLGLELSNFRGTAILALRFLLGCLLQTSFRIPSVFFFFARKFNYCAIPPNMGLALCDWLRSWHYHNKWIEERPRVSFINQNTIKLETRFGHWPSESFQNLSSRNLCRMEFLNLTAAVFVSKSLLLKLSKHVDYTLIDNKDKCCFMSVTSTLPVHGTKYFAK